MTETSSTATDSAAATQEDSLLAGCRYCVSQCESLLQILSAEDYCRRQGENSSVGTHLRHVLDRYHCFFEGLSGAAIDYDRRERNRLYETDIGEARAMLKRIANRIRNLNPAQFSDSTLVVHESVHPDGPTVAADSSMKRELMSLVSHSIHHLAIIGLLVKAMGYRLDSDFGKAPSTIIHERT